MLDASQNKIAWESPSCSCLVHGLETATSSTFNTGPADCEVGSWSLRVLGRHDHFMSLHLWSIP